MISWIPLKTRFFDKSSPLFLTFIVQEAAKKSLHLKHSISFCIDSKIPNNYNIAD